MRPAELKAKAKKCEVLPLAIYHMTTKPISRKSGRSATASSAYRNACKIKDERTGLEHDYSKKQGVVYSACFDRELNKLDRNELWNKAELAENRKDARTAREYIIAIPHELMPDYPEPIPDLTDEEKKDPQKVREHKLKLIDYKFESELAISKAKKSPGVETALAFAKHIADKLEVGVDIAIHAPDRHGNNKNWHAHIMTTTRKIELENGEIKLGDKSNIELSNKKLHELNLPKNQTQVKEFRQDWEDIANDFLEKNNYTERIDHRSYKDQKIDKIPTIKMGWKASDMERDGIETDRGNINRFIIKRNKKIKELRDEIEEDIREDQLKNTEPVQHIIEPISVQKTKIGWRVYDNYHSLINLHNNNIDDIKNNPYNKNEIIENSKRLYELADDIYSNIDSNKNNINLSRTDIERVKESVDEIKNNYSRFIDKTIIKNDRGIIDAQQKASLNSEKCLTDNSKHPSKIDASSTEIKNYQPKFKP